MVLSPLLFCLNLRLCGGFEALVSALMAAAFNNQTWTRQSFFDPPRVQAREIVEFGVGKTYDFFA